MNTNENENVEKVIENINFETENENNLIQSESFNTSNDKNFKNLELIKNSQFASNEISQAPKKVHYSNISLIRLLATIFIITYHFLYYWTDVAQTYFPFYFAVPIFLFISGFLYSKKQIKDVKKFYFKNYVKILVPVILFFAIYFTIFLIFFIFNIKLELIEVVPCGKNAYIFGHLWFIYAICLCYFFVPLINFFITNKTNKEKLILFISFIILICLINIFLMAFCGSCSMFIPFLIGYFFKYLYEKIGVKAKTALSILGLLVFILSSVFHYYLVNFIGNFKYFELVKELTIVLMGVSFTVFLLISFEFLNKKDIKTQKLLNISDKYSFYLYIVHPIFMLGGLSAKKITNNIYLAFFLVIIFTIGFSVILEFLTQKICNKVFNLKKIKSKI